MIKSTLKRIWVWTAVLGLAVLMVRAFGQVHKDRAGPDEDEESKEVIKTPSRVSVQSGQNVITLDPTTQSRAGITAVALKALTTCEQVAAAAVVLSGQELISLRNNYVSATARLEKARANAVVAQQEFDRLKALYA